jgi:uncharacterized membrane protein (UPF0127 family)
MIDRRERLVRASDGQPVATRLLRADRWLHRLRGLIAYLPLETGEALWIEPCSQVHTHFMAYPIHAVFLDLEGRVLRVVGPLPPWRVSPHVRGARVVVEFSAGAPLALAVGERLLAVSAAP